METSIRIIIRILFFICKFSRSSMGDVTFTIRMHEPRNSSLDNNQLQAARPRHTQHGPSRLHCAKRTRRLDIRIQRAALHIHSLALLAA